MINLKNLEFHQLIGKLKIEHEDLIINIQDINYEYSVKNKTDFRTEWITFYTKKNFLEYLNRNKCSEVF